MCRLLLLLILLSSHKLTSSTEHEGVGLSRVGTKIDELKYAKQEENSESKTSLSDDDVSKGLASITRNQKYSTDKKDNTQIDESRSNEKYENMESKLDDGVNGLSFVTRENSKKGHKKEEVDKYIKFESNERPHKHKSIEEQSPRDYKPSLAEGREIRHILNVPGSSSEGGKEFEMKAFPDVLLRNPVGVPISGLLIPLDFLSPIPSSKRSKASTEETYDMVRFRRSCNCDGFMVSDNMKLIGEEKSDLNEMKEEDEKRRDKIHHHDSKKGRMGKRHKIKKSKETVGGSNNKRTCLCGSKLEDGRSNSQHSSARIIDVHKSTENIDAPKKEDEENEDDTHKSPEKEIDVHKPQKAHRRNHKHPPTHGGDGGNYAVETTPIDPPLLGHGGYFIAEPEKEYPQPQTNNMIPVVGTQGANGNIFNQGIGRMEFTGGAFDDTYGQYRDITYGTSPSSSVPSVGFTEDDMRNVGSVVPTQEYDAGPVSFIGRTMGSDGTDTSNSGRIGEFNIGIGNEQRRDSIDNLHGNTDTKRHDADTLHMYRRDVTLNYFPLRSPDQNDDDDDENDDEPKVVKKPASKNHHLRKSSSSLLIKPFGQDDDDENDEQPEVVKKPVATKHIRRQPSARASYYKKPARTQSTENVTDDEPSYQQPNRNMSVGIVNDIHLMDRNDVDASISEFGEHPGEEPIANGIKVMPHSRNRAGAVVNYGGHYGGTNSAYGGGNRADYSGGTNAPDTYTGGTRGIEQNAEENEEPPPPPTGLSTDSLNVPMDRPPIEDEDVVNPVDLLTTGINGFPLPNNNPLMHPRTAKAAPINQLGRTGHSGDPNDMLAEQQTNDLYNHVVDELPQQIQQFHQHAKPANREAYTDTLPNAEQLQHKNDIQRKGSAKSHFLFT